jgi:hypothetical protein
LRKANRKCKAIQAPGIHPENSGSSSPDSNCRHTDTHRLKLPMVAERADGLFGRRWRRAGRVLGVVPPGEGVAHTLLLFCL